MFLTMVRYHGNEKLKGMVEYNIFNNLVKAQCKKLFPQIWVNIPPTFSVYTLANMTFHWKRSTTQTSALYMDKLMLSRFQSMGELIMYVRWPYLRKLTSFPSFLVIFVDVARQLFAVTGFSPCPSHLLHHILCVLVSGRYGSWFTCMYLKCVLTSFVQKS